MKPITPAIIYAFAILLSSTARTLAVEGQALQVQGTNLVLYWPSPGGYQEYLIQYRQTLDPSAAWTNLANNYFANDTNFTTYTIVGAVPLVQDDGDGGGGDTNLDYSQGFLADALGAPLEPVATLADGSGPIVPLCLYPPDFDMSRFLIYDPALANWTSGATYARADSFASADQMPAARVGVPLDDPDPPGGDPPSLGFYRVFHIPDWFFDVTNYTYDGPWFFPVDFADYMDRIDNLKVLLNGVETDYAQFMPYDMGNGQTNWGMGISFDRIPNGGWTIQLVASLRLNDLIGDGELYLTLSNQVRTISVSNQITFTNWNEVIQGDAYTFNAQILNSNSDWWIDIYDAWGYYVNTGSGHATNGQISWTWDLTDYLGYSRADFDSDPVFYSQTTFYPSGSSQPLTVRNPDTSGGYPGTGQWITTYMLRWYTDAPGYPSDCQQKLLDAMAAVQGGPVLKGDASAWLPVAFGTNAYTQDQRDASWANLKSTLSNGSVRNWYYYGHGGANEIGADNHILDTNGLVVSSARQPNSKAYLTSQDVKQAVGLNRHRFTFLDGCMTATGDWPAALGIDKTQHNRDYYTSTNTNPKGLRPAVFVGWNTTPGGPGWPATVYQGLDFRKNWMGYWAVSFPPINITNAIEQAASVAGYLTPDRLRSTLMIYGFSDMTMEEYNHAGDWRP